MKDILNAKQAAVVIGCAPVKVQERMIRGLWPLGRVLTPAQTGRKCNVYEISRKRLADFLEIPEEEVDKRLEEYKTKCRES